MVYTCHAVVLLVDRDYPYVEGIRLDGLDPGILGLVETQSMWQPYMAEVAATGHTLRQWRLLAERDAVQLLAGPAAELRWRFRCSKVALLVHGRLAAKRWLQNMDDDAFCDFAKVRNRLS